MEVFRHVYMTNCSYFYFRWLKAWGPIIFHWCFDYDGWWLNLHILLLIPWVNWWLNFLTLNAFLWYDHCWTHLSCHLSFRSLPSGLSLSTLFTLPMTIFTLRRLVIFDHSNEMIFIGIVSYGCLLCQESFSLGFSSSYLSVWLGFGSRDCSTTPWL